MYDPNYNLLSLYNANCKHVFRTGHLVSGNQLVCSLLGRLFLLHRDEASWPFPCSLKAVCCCPWSAFVRQSCWEDFMVVASDSASRQNFTANPPDPLPSLLSTRFPECYVQGYLVDVPTGTGFHHSAF